MAENYHLRNVKFIEWVDEEMLTDLIANSQVVLGAFGDTPQSMMTIQNKIYTGLAMAKPVISGDSTAIRRELQDKKHILLCNRKDPQSLAETILLLYRNPQLAKKISIEGYRLFTNRFSLEKIGSLFYQHLVELMAK
jgi:glycosyltransferase involved in cell wall biosynthesis